MAYVTLFCSLRWDAGQLYGFRKALVTHVRANMDYFKSEGSENIFSYMNDSYEKFWKLLLAQGYFKEAEKLGNKVLDTRKKFLGVEHQETIRAQVNLALVYQNKIYRCKEAGNTSCGCNKQTSWSRTPTYDESQDKSDSNILKLEKIHVHRSRETGNTSPGSNEQNSWRGTPRNIESQGKSGSNLLRAKANLAATYYELGKYAETEKLEMQVLDARNRIFGVEHPEIMTAVGNLALTYNNLGNTQKQISWK